MNDLYLIGNGFDLAHGLKTSYNDFLLWYLKDALNSYNESMGYNDQLISISHNGESRKMKEVESISDILEWCNKSNYVIRFNSTLFEKILNGYKSFRWVDIEYEYFMALVAFYKRLEKAGVLKHDQIDKELKSLNSCFSLIKAKLADYLKECIRMKFEFKNDLMEDILFDGIFNDKGARSEKETLFVCFNYTQTIGLYLNNTILEKNIIYIHGKLNDPNYPIIFGYGDEMDPHYEKIENLNNNEFLKNIKSFNYFKTDNYQQVISFIEGEGREFTVKILGHSCGLSDRILLNTIFEHPNCKHIKIFHYEKSPTENDYFEKTQEISRHFKASKKGEMRLKIVPFDKYSAIPQNSKDN